MTAHWKDSFCPRKEVKLDYVFEGPQRIVDLCNNWYVNLRFPLIGHWRGKSPVRQATQPQSQARMPGTQVKALDYYDCLIAMSPSHKFA